MNSTPLEQNKLYMLHVLQTETPALTWRYLLQVLGSEQLRAFHSLEGLETYLQAQIQEQDPITQTNLD